MNVIHRQQDCAIGLDQMNASRWKMLDGSRVALLCHAASVDSSFEHITQSCARFGVDVQLCFGPEHGIWADAQDMIGVESDQIEPVTGAPVVSLYGSNLESLTPRPEHFRNVDVLVIDLQDVGSRYYTYIYTATLAMAAAAKVGVRTVVLDRPNPIGGTLVEGGMTHQDYLSFVGMWSLPTRHGLTLGEVLSYLNKREEMNAELEVVTVKNWSTGLYADEYRYPWVQPSPNMPTVETAAVYPGMCLIEGTNLSEGRGTTRPFELIGADFIEPFEWAETLNELNLPGIQFRPVNFQPTFHKFGGQTIGGVALHVTNRAVFQPLRAGLFLLWTVRQLYGSALQWRSEVYEFVNDRLAIDLLFGGTDAREAIDGHGSRDTLDQMYQDWCERTMTFHKSLSGSLLYPRGSESNDA